MSQRGEYGLFTTQYNRLKADKTENRNHKANSVTEYLHYVICKGNTTKRTIFTQYNFKMSKNRQNQLIF